MFFKNLQTLGDASSLEISTLFELYDLQDEVKVKGHRTNDITFHNFVKTIGKYNQTNTFFLRISTIIHRFYPRRNNLNRNTDADFEIFIRKVLLLQNGLTQQS